jgi:hypothetical protein
MRFSLLGMRFSQVRLRFREFMDVIYPSVDEILTECG